MELEKVNKDLLDKAESLSRQNKSNDTKLHEQESRLKQLSVTLSEQTTHLYAYKSNLPSTMVKLHELAQQKRLLVQMLGKATKDLSKARAYVKKLLPRH